MGCQHQAPEILNPNREIYFTDPNAGVPPSEYVTEIQFPVEKKG
jgi:effector-binding domain-containing protein